VIHPVSHHLTTNNLNNTSQIASNQSLPINHVQPAIIMQFTAAILALAAGASVTLAQVNPALCAGRVAQCCQLDVLDLAAISCENRA
jgi:hypothetical protein